MDFRSLMKALSSEVNLEILAVLRTGAFHPRELARILGRDESDVSRRLRQLERLGLVEGRWERDGERNVRVYSLKVEEIKISFEPEGIKANIDSRPFYETSKVGDDVPEVDTFVGRREEIELLRKCSEGVVVIYGVAGVGKTLLAAKAFPDSFWYRVSGVEDFEYIAWHMGRFLNSRGYGLLLDYMRSGQREEREVFELILEGIERTSSVIVLDDVHKCQDERLERLLTFLAERMKGGKIVVTTRVKPNLGTRGVLYIHLKGLKPEEAYELALAKGVKMDVGRFAEVYHLTAGHPLMLNLTLEGLSREGRIVKDNLFEFLFAEVYSALSSEEKEMLSLLATFDDPVEYEAIKRLYGEKRAFSVLYSLLRKGLVERHEESYYLHELIRSMVGRFSKPNPKYLLMYTDYLLEKNDPASFLKAFKYAVRSGEKDRIKLLTEIRLRRFKWVVNDFPNVYMKLLMEAGDNPYAKNEIGHIHFQRGFFERARKIWMEVKDELDGIHLADAMSSLADVCMELEDMECAERYLTRLEELMKELKDPEVRLWYYVERTKYEFYRENLEGALESAFEELKTLRDLEGFPELEAIVRLHIGDIYLGMGEVEKALSYYDEALRIAENYGLTFIKFLAYIELGKAHYYLKNYPKAVEFESMAVEYFREIRNYRHLVEALGYRAVAYLGLQRPSKTLEDGVAMIKIGQATNYPLSWGGYVFMAAAKAMLGEPFEEYLTLAKKHLSDNPYLYSAIIEELSRVFDVTKLQQGAFSERT